MKFSIRDLLLVTVIVALALGWWVDRSRLASREQPLKHIISQLCSQLGEASDKPVTFTLSDGTGWVVNGDPFESGGISRIPLEVPKSQTPAPNP